MRANKMINIVNADKNNFEEIFKIVESSRYFPMRYIKGREKNARALWREDIQNKFSKGALGLMIMEDKVVKGFSMLDGLPWDSDVFGKRMGTISCMEIDPCVHAKQASDLLNSIIELARREGYEFLLSKTYTDNVQSVHLFEGAGFKLVDTLLDFVWEKEDFASTRENGKETMREFEISFAEKRDEEELRRIAKSAFGGHFGRYHSDPNISREKACSVYEEWISSSLKGYADYFLVAKRGGEIAGYSIWKKQSSLEAKYEMGIGHYSIAGISPKFQGKGLFSLLTSEGMALLEKDIERIEGPTHINNYPVQRGYTKLGWRIVDAKHSFHKWM
jgi:ribosomal protein S18 acetylase RimI-like enzyme